jgi:tetratricopeptide (TPR) repeat protein
MQRFVRRVAFFLLLFAGLLGACPLHGQAPGIDELLERARAAQASGNYSDAATLYARTTALSPNTPELWSNRGVMEYLAGQIDASTLSLKHALQLNPRLFAPMLFLGKGYGQTGKPALALPYLNHAHTLRPNDPEVLLALGKTNANLNRQRQAQSFYANAAQLTPKDPEAWFGLGVASLEVIAVDGRDLATSHAQSIWARTLYADELLAQGRPLESVDTYKAALASASPIETAIVARNLEWLQSHPDLFPIPSNSQEALQRLEEQIKSEQSKAALPPCTTSVQLLEDAACAFWVGDYERSANKAGEALRQSPQSAEALYWSVKANERMAVAALSRFEELAPQSAASYVMVANLYRHQRETDSALSEYKKALAIDPHDPAALMGAVTVALSAGKLDEASAMDQVALTDQPHDPQLNLLMAEILATRNEYDKVKPYLAKCLAAPPELQPRVHYLLARADLEDGNTQEAIKQFEMALPGDEDGSIHYQLSRLYRKTGNLAQAQKAEEGAKAVMKQRRANAAIVVREATGTNP